jgi:hypothetical protein
MRAANLEYAGEIEHVAAANVSDNFLLLRDEMTSDTRRRPAPLALGYTKEDSGMLQPKIWILALLFVFTSSTPALASAIGLGTWYEFGFDPDHSPLAAGCQPADAAGVPCPVGIGSTFAGSSPWTITTGSPVEMTITDAFLAGDFFDVFDFGVLAGSTPSVAASGMSCGLDPSVCVDAAGFSHASFALAAGAHSITVGVHEAQIVGEGFFRLDAVPEPSTFAVTALLVAMLLGWWKLCQARGRS